jgi:hypothetical protein
MWYLLNIHVYIGVYNIVKRHATGVDTRISSKEGKGSMLFINYHYTTILLSNRLLHA